MDRDKSKELMQRGLAVLYCDEHLFIEGDLGVKNGKQVWRILVLLMSFLPIASFPKVTKINDRVTCLSPCSKPPTFKWYGGEIWPGILIPFLHKWLLGSRWVLGSNLHVTTLSWVTKQGGIYGHKCSTLCSRQGLHTEDHVLVLGNSVGTLSSNYKGNTVLSRAGCWLSVSSCVAMFSRCGVNATGGSPAGALWMTSLLTMALCWNLVHAQPNSANYCFQISLLGMLWVTKVQLKMITTCHVWSLLVQSHFPLGSHYATYRHRCVLILLLFAVFKTPVSSSWLEFFSFTVDTRSSMDGVVELF